MQQQILMGYGAGGGGGDPYWSNVASLLHFDGTNGSTTFTDQKSMTWTPTSATLSTAQAKFGATSGNFTIGDARIQSGTAIPTGMSGDFTIEGHIYLTTGGVVRCVCRWASSNKSIYINSSNQLSWYNGSGSGFGAFSGAVTLNAWHHFAVTRSGTTIRTFLDGVLSATTVTDSTSLNTTFTVGGDFFSQPLLGYLDDFRITDGVCRYTTGFTPPAAPFPDS